MGTALGTGYRRRSVRARHRGEPVPAATYRATKIPITMTVIALTMADCIMKAVAERHFASRR